MIVNNLGLIEYGQAWELQRRYFAEVQNGSEDILLLCQHPHVYTLGKSGDANNLLINESFLEQIHASYYKTDRGGDITYHGPGQLVGYPILNLRKQELSIREYIAKLEQSIINTLELFDVHGLGTLPTATGVWINGNRKICAIGVKASHNITMHGFALNITTDLEYFKYINPCGFTDKGVTSLELESSWRGSPDELFGMASGRYEEEFLHLFK